MFRVLQKKVFKVVTSPGERCLLCWNLVDKQAGRLAGGSDAYPANDHLPLPICLCHLSPLSIIFSLFDISSLSLVESREKRNLGARIRWLGCFELMTTTDPQQGSPILRFFTRPNATMSPQSLCYYSINGIWTSMGGMLPPSLGHRLRQWSPVTCVFTFLEKVVELESGQLSMLPPALTSPSPWSLFNK